MAAWRYEISLLVLKKYFSTLEEKFCVSTRPCNILYNYIEVLFHIFYYYWGKENCLIYGGLCCFEVRYIKVPLYQ